MKVAFIIGEKKKRGIELYSIPEDATLKDAAGELSKNNVGALLVSKKDNPEEYISLISERDIIHRCCEDRPLDNILVSDSAVPSDKMMVVTVDDTLEAARTIMAEHHIRHLPVLKDKEIVGMITIRDIIKVMDEQKDIKLQHLSDFVGGTYNSNVF